MRIEKPESFYAKDVYQVSQTWESMIDDAELEKTLEEICTAETEVTQLKSEMKKVPLAKNIPKATEMKKLQQ